MLVEILMVHETVSMAEILKFNWHLKVLTISSNRRAEHKESEENDITVNLNTRHSDQYMVENTFPVAERFE